MSMMEEKLREGGHVMLIKAAFNGGKVDVLIVSDCMPVVIKECVCFFINEACKKVNSIPQLVQCKICEGENLKKKF